MLTRKRIEELREGASRTRYGLLLLGLVGGADNSTMFTSEEMTELLDAAEAWRLYAEARAIAAGEAWEYNRHWCALQRVETGHPTPQAAVLAALRPKGEPEP